MSIYTKMNITAKDAFWMIILIVFATACIWLSIILPKLGNKKATNCNHSYKHEYFEAKVTVCFNDNSTKNYQLNISDSRDNIFLVKGDLSYCKPVFNSSDGVVSRKIYLASFVRWYKITAYKYKELWEKE